MSQPQKGFGSIGQDSDVLELSLNHWGKAIKKNYYGVEAPVNGTLKRLSDWNADGAVLMAKEFQKALDENDGDYLKTLGAGSAPTGVLTPVKIQPGIIDIVRRNTPGQAMIQKIPAVGKTVHVPRRTARVTPVWTAGDGAALTGLDPVFTEVTQDQAYLYTPGSIAWPAQKLTEKTINLNAETMNAHMLDHMYYKEQIMFRASDSAGSGIASILDISAEASNYDGLLRKMEESATANLVDLAGARGINLGDIEKQYADIENNGGFPGVTFCDRATFTRLKKEASAAGRIDFSIPKYGFGLREFNIDEIPVVWSPGLVATSGQCVAVSLDFRAWGEYPLLSEEMVPVAQQMADKKEFYIRNYTTMVIQAEEWASGHVDATS